ncbi:hypothetical protein B0H13DRAFT_1895159 [Mycena leptocephala]|nr:hypothetical protein B0H13DRAFT_1895159 [Mycena leptocephala]
MTCRRDPDPCCLNINTTASVTANSGSPTPLVLPILTPTLAVSLLSKTPLGGTNAVPTPTSISTIDQNQSGRTSVGAIRNIDQEVAPRAYDASIVPPGRFNNSASGFERPSTADVGVPASYFAPSRLESTTSNPPSQSRFTSDSSVASPAAQGIPANIGRNKKTLENRGVGPSLPSDISSELVTNLPPPVYET